MLFTTPMQEPRNLDPIIIKMIPKVIDTLIKVDSGKMKINKKPWTKCLACFPCYGNQMP